MIDTYGEAPNNAHTSVDKIKVIFQSMPCACV